MRTLYVVPLIALLVLAPTVRSDAELGAYGAPATGKHLRMVENIVSLEKVRPLQRGTDLLALPIKSAEGFLSGKVQDIVFTADNRRVDHLAVAFDQRPGEICKVPHGELKITADGKTLVRDFGAANITAPRCFSANAWPAELEARRFSRLLSFEVRDPLGKEAGTLKDLLIDSEDGRIREATLSVGDKLASVDWASFTFPAGERYARIRLRSDELARLAYEKGEYWDRLGFAGEKSERGGSKSKSSGSEPKHKGFSEPMATHEFGF